MKTQLLEDIGQSATLSLVPSGKVSNTNAQQGVGDIAQAPAAASAGPRSTVGVWRQKPAGETVFIATEQPDQQPLPAETPAAIEPVAAVKAQQVPPQPVHDAAVPRAEPTLAANATQGQPEPYDPLFDFTSSWSTRPAPDLPSLESAGIERSGRRYLLWGSCALSGALIILAGLWFYEGRKDASALALVADESDVQPQIDKAMKRRAIAAKEFTLGPDGEVGVTPAAPASSPSPISRPVPTVPPLVLLEPAPAAATRVEPAAALDADREVLQTPPKPDLAAEAPATPLPKRVRRAGREQVVAATKPAPVMRAEKKSEADSAMAATLKGCRELGYHAAQCVRRACSMTKYGLVCRGK